MHEDPSDLGDAPPDVLTLMLFQGAVRFGRQALAAIEAGDDRLGERTIARTRAIVEQLDASLDHGAGSIARHLTAIYDYLLRRLAVAAGDREALEEVVMDLEELAETWSALVAAREIDAVGAAQ